MTAAWPCSPGGWRNRPCVIRLLCEGGGIHIHGCQEADGSWSFIGTRMTMEIEVDGNDTVKVGGIPRFTDLAQGLPRLWIAFIPMQIHPDLRSWFRERYAAAVASLPAHARESHEQFRHHKWQALFESTPPDRWSECDSF